MRVYVVLILIAGVLAVAHLAGYGWLIGLVVGIVFAAEVAICVFYGGVFVRDMLAARKARRLVELEGAR